MFKKIGIPLAPFTLALVLGNRAEDAFRLSMIGAGGDLRVFWSNGLVGSITTLALILLFWPRVRAKELWRVAPELLEQAQDDATLLAIRDQERAGLDIITDGEMRRESYSNRFATALEGVDIDNPGTALDRSGHPNPVPRVAGKVRRKHPVEVRDVQFPARQHRPHDQDDGARPVHHVAAGAERFLQGRGGDGARLRRRRQCRDQGPVRGRRRHRADRRALYAGAAGEGAPIRPQGAQPRARRRGRGTAVHICFGYAAIIHVRPSGYSFLPELANSPVQQVSIETAQSKLDCSVLEKLPRKTIILGVLDLSDMTIETPETVAARIRRALDYVPIERLVVAPDCGLKYLPREVAFKKMQALVAGTRIVRRELGAE